MTIAERIITEPVGVATLGTEFVVKVGGVVQNGGGVEQVVHGATIALPSPLHHQALQAVALVVAHPLTTTPPNHQQIHNPLLKVLLYHPVLARIAQIEFHVKDGEEIDAGSLTHLEKDERSALRRW